MIIDYKVAFEQLQKDIEKRSNLIDKEQSPILFNIYDHILRTFIPKALKHGGRG